MIFYSTGETDYNEWNSSTDSKLETDYISNFFNKYQYVNLNGLMKRVLNQNEMNGVVKLNNGFLITPNGYIDEEVVSRRADRVQSFSQHLEEKGIQYLYVTIPFVVDKNNPQIPTGVSEYGNENLDNYKNAMEGRGVQCLDLRDSIHDDGLETYDLFYRTDHHWTTKGGFYGYQKITEYLEKTNHFEVDPVVKNLDNYSITTYERWHLGSNGQRTGKYYGGIDNFDLILPKFDSTLENWDRSASGTMDEMMIDKTALQKKDYMSRYTYDSVMGGSIGNFHNPNALVDKTILIIGDSFSKSMMPYFALSFSNVLFVGNNNTASITADYIETYQPDIVISAYYITWGARDDAYDFSY